MYKISKKHVDILEEYGFTVTKDKNGYLFSRFSTAGQDFNFFIPHKPTKRDFVVAILEYYEDYDVSEEAALWIDQFGHGKNGAPHDLEDIINDMEECEGFIYEAYEILSNIKKMPFVVKTEKCLVASLSVDAYIYERTLKIDSEEKEEALKKILEKQYFGKELFFEANETLYPVSSKEILPKGDKSVGFVLMNEKGGEMAVKTETGWLISHVTFKMLGNGTNVPQMETRFQPDGYCEDEISEPCVVAEEGNLSVWSNPEHWNEKIPFENPVKAGEKI